VFICGRIIYFSGRGFKSSDLIQLVTGSELSEKAYFDYLKTKYSKIYEISIK